MTVSEQFDRYQIKHIIGKGGMATVYLATDPRIGRDVALKVMSYAYRDDPTFRGRFEREARTIATLEHPAIVPVYDFGEDHNQLYLVMRYMPGGSLADRIHQRPLPLANAIPLIQRIGAALDHAHKRGVIHRDLKPANILFDQYDNPFLSDFGIVKLQEATTGYTGSGIIGTPAYMSPEQIHGEEEIDGRSDVYTLGVLFFEMLTGIKPFRAETPVKQMMAHVLDPIPHIRTLNTNLPPDLEPIVQTVLAKDRDKRFTTAGAFSQALTRSFPAFATHSPTSTAEALTAVSPPSATPSDSSRTMTLGSVTETTAPPPSPVVEQATMIQTPASTTPGPIQRSFPWRYVVIGLTAVILIIGGMGLAIFWPFGQGDSDIGNQTPPGLAPTPTTAAAAIITPDFTPEAAATDTPAATTTAPTPTTAGLVTRFTIARTVFESPIEAVRFGTGNRNIFLVGGLHAGFAPGAVKVAEQAVTYFEENEAEIPAEVSVWIIPNLNPDSAPLPGELDGRLNGNGVDLNRNWGCLWQPSPPWRGTPMPGMGGTSPFSEPEISGLVDFFQQHPPALVLFWGARATNGLVSAGSCDDRPYVSATLARTFATGSGYQYVNFEGLTEEKIPGDGTNWLDQQGIPAMTVLLPDYDATDWDRNLAGIMALVTAVANTQTNPAE